MKIITATKKHSDSNVYYYLNDKLNGYEYMRICDDLYSRYYHVENSNPRICVVDRRKQFYRRLKRFHMLKYKGL